jgi:hypothetical protein
MRRIISGALLVGACLPVLGAPAPVEKTGTAKELKASRERVQKLFAAMREGRYDDNGFPALSWQDVPALLEIAPSRVVVRRFPRNPLASQFQQECSEGMVALWLIEGIRKRGKYPSHNALCFRPGPARGDYGQVSERNHDQALKAYQAWWKKVGHLPPDRAAVVPLRGTGLSWY